jgi:hypothetical protein
VDQTGDEEEGQGAHHEVGSKGFEDALSVTMCVPVDNIG